MFCLSPLARVLETVSARELEIWPYHVATVISTSYLERRQEVLPRFIAALEEAVYFTNTHPDKATL